MNSLWVEHKVYQDAQIKQKVKTVHIKLLYFLFANSKIFQ